MVNKPSGILSQGDHTGDKNILDYAKAYIKKKYDKPGDVYLHPVHRLDRPTSGALILARTSKGLERMQEQFRERKVEKRYLALTQKGLAELEGELKHYLIKDTKSNVSRAVSKDKKGNKLAVLQYKLLRQDAGYYLFEIRLDTGRSHQIRAQLSNKNAVIVGDLKYGFKTPNKDKSICLHSKTLSFMHPVKKEPVNIKARILNKEHWHSMAQ